MNTFDNFSGVTYQPNTGKYWFFKGEECWTKEYSEDNVIYEGLIKDHFSDDLTNIDAVATTGSKYWFFKGDKCWSKEFGERISDKENISDEFPGLPSHIDAACYMHGTYWFFKGGKCWSKDSGKKVKLEGSISQNFPGLPSVINSAVSAKGKYWFFSGDECWSKKRGGNVKSEGKILGHFPYYIEVNHPESWMENNLSLIGEKYLRQITLPGSHDSGMSSSHDGTFAACDGNTKTQSKNLLSQLEAGVRYFDVRPIIGSGDFHTGHYTEVKEEDVDKAFNIIINVLPDYLKPGFSSLKQMLAGPISKIIGWQGARGESIGNIINDVNYFIKSKRELIILYLSHAYNTDQDYHDFTVEEWRNLLDKLKNNLNCLYSTSENLLNNVKIKEYLKEGSAIVIVIPDKVQNLLIKDGYSLGNGIYSESTGGFKTDGEYANTSDLKDMIDKELEILQDFSNHHNKLLKTSWTLTQNGAQVLLSNTGIFSDLIKPFLPNVTIKDLADHANNDINKLMENITIEKFPNIITTDYYPDKAMSVAAYSNLMASSRN